MFVTMKNNYIEIQKKLQHINYSTKKKLNFNQYIPPTAIEIYIIKCADKLKLIII